MHFALLGFWDLDYFLFVLTTILLAYYLGSTQHRNTRCVRQASRTYHVALGGELLHLDALYGHPADRQGARPVLHAVVVRHVDVPGEAEVCDEDPT